MGSVTGLQAAMGRYIGLEAFERRLLDRLEHRPVKVARDQVLWSPEDRVTNLFSLQSGWACTFRDTCEGECQIIELLLPGDIIGLREFTFRRHASQARMITPGSLCGFAHEVIADLVLASPSLAIALFAAIARQEALLTERMLVTLHRPARVQVCHFVIETFLRLNKVQAVDPGQMPFPLSQQLLAQILGQSTVHINRTLMALDRDGLLKKHRGYITIHDMRRLYQEAEFDDGYLSDRLDGLEERLAKLRMASR
ncbi:Crp/Fnr family transcriptional regulator [Halomonas nitroreducens]|nr:Crp/Fnr family transcriptional regulator [Halomonas nitroreducens]